MQSRSKIYKCEHYLNINCGPCFFDVNRFFLSSTENACSTNFARFIKILLYICTKLHRYFHIFSRFVRIETKKSRELWFCFYFESNLQANGTHTRIFQKQASKKSVSWFGRIKVELIVRAQILLHEFVKPVAESLIKICKYGLLFVRTSHRF